MGLQHTFHRYKWWLLAGVLLLVLGWWLWIRDNASQARFSTSPVTRGTIENLVTATGVLQPRAYVDVGAQVSGQLKVLHVDVGSQVKEGDLLAEIDATVSAARVEGTRAQLRNQQAQLKEREAQLKLARINYERQRNLFKEEASTKEALQSAEASLQSSEAQLESLRAQMAQTESSLRAEEATLEYAKIYAPMSGTVVSITSRQGQTLNANQTAPTVLRIADLTVMTVQAQVSEADVSKLTNGMPVYFTTFGGGGKRWYSTLDRIEPTPTVLNNVVLYNALFDVPNPDGVLMTQMTTQVFFIASQARNVLQVPVAALNFAKPALGTEGAKVSGPDRSAPPQEGRQPKSSPSEQALEANQPLSPNQSSSPNTVASQEGKHPERRGSSGASSRSSSNATDASASRAATVKVLVGKNQVEERQVTVGVSNRVRAEVLSGLQENELVVIGDSSGQQAPRDGSAGGPPPMGGMRMMR